MKNRDRFKFAIYKTLDKSENVAEIADHLFSKGYKEILCDKPGLRLFVSRGEPKPPVWKYFLEQITRDKTVSELSKTTPCFVLLYSIENEHYAITGGSGHHHINDFIEEEFGLDAISRILEADRIKLIRQAPFGGRVRQEEKIFKEFYNYNFDNSNWGKLTREILGEIDKKTLNKVFNLTRKIGRSTKIAGKSSFWLSRGVTSEELISVINTLHRIYLRVPNFKLLAGYEQIKDKLVIERLDEALIEQLSFQYDDYCRNPNAFTENRIHISYSDAKELLICDDYLISLPKVKEAESSKSLELTRIFEVLHKNQFSEFTANLMTRIHITGRDADKDETSLHGALRKFIYAEVTHENSKYYFVGGIWYSLSSEFEEQINKNANEILKSCSDPSFSLPNWKGWTTNSKEPDYINEICRDPKFVKMHDAHVFLKVGKNNKTELCDVVSLRDIPDLVFIKRGTGSSLRELFSQARASIELFQNDTKFWEAATLKVCERRHSRNGGKISFEKYRVVLAIIDDNLNRSHRSLVDKLTTLAKLDLFYCVNFLREQGVRNVIVYEIKREMPSRTTPKKLYDVSELVS